MTGDPFEQPPGASPLSPDDTRGLIPTWVANRDDLNRAEAENIAAAMRWAFLDHGPWTPDGLLAEDVLYDLHARMFGDVWRWAGTPRTRVTSLGVLPYEIGEQLRQLLGDVKFRVSDAGAPPWSADELAVRFHHRLVTVHPFANGNGRHARLAADILVVSLGSPRFTWGGSTLGDDGQARTTYLTTLRHADATQDFAHLVEFARS